MAKKLYPLRNVPEDELAQMRELLQAHEIKFHETHAGLLGIGTAAIWVNNTAQYDQARVLIEQYQQERYEKASSDYAREKALSIQTRFSDLFKENPLKVSLYIALALLLIILMTGPFWF